MNEVILPVVFLAIAFFYSSVGFGGGSSYLAILSLVLTDFHEIRTTALVFNLVVVTIGTVVFVRNKVFNFRTFGPFIVCSVPMAFFGAQLRLSEKAFFLILGSSLVLSALFMGLQALRRTHQSRGFLWYKRGALGGTVGFLSGLAGIGGGIFLSPILNLIGWANPRTVAALASTFILVNSVSGLSGLLVAQAFQFEIHFAGPLLIAVMVGGSLGAYVSGRQFNIYIIRWLTAILVAYVGFRLVLQHGFGIYI